MRRSRHPLIAAALDVVSVLAFVVLGRSSHDEAQTIGSVLGVAAPFVIGLAVGWLAARAWRAPFASGTGAIVWISTVAVGMVLRHWAWDRGTAFAFVVVATLFLGLFLLGWRALARLAEARRGTATAS